MVTETKRSFLLSIRLDYASTNTTFGEIKDSNEKVKGGLAHQDLSIQTGEKAANCNPGLRDIRVVYPPTIANCGNFGIVS